CTPRERALAMAFLDHCNQSSACAPTTPSDANMARLAHCESRGNPRVVSQSGTYRGLYQFSQSTWNSVAQKHRPDLYGKNPAHVSPIEQTEMARWLLHDEGWTHWPVCGRTVIGTY